MNVNSDNLIFIENSDEIHSFDANYSNVILYQNNLLIPYTNLGISNHSLNKTADLKFLDFAYIVCLGIKYLSVYIEGKRLTVIKYNSYKSYPKYNMGGFYMDYDSGIFNDIEIYSENAFLQLIENTQVSERMWSDKSFNDANILDKEKVESFFALQFLPSNVRNIFPCF